MPSDCGISFLSPLLKTDSMPYSDYPLYFKEQVGEIRNVDDSYAQFWLNLRPVRLDRCPVPPADRKVCRPSWGASVISTLLSIKKDVFYPAIARAEQKTSFYREVIQSFCLKQTWRPLLLKTPHYRETREQSRAESYSWSPLLLITGCR